MHSIKVRYPEKESQEADCYLSAHQQLLMAAGNNIYIGYWKFLRRTKFKDSAQLNKENAWGYLHDMIL